MRIEVDDKGFTKPVEGTANAEVCLKSGEDGFLKLMLGRIEQNPEGLLKSVAQNQ
jgi:purine nucleosidase